MLKKKARQRRQRKLTEKRLQSRRTPSEFRQYGWHVERIIKRARRQLKCSMSHHHCPVSHGTFEMATTKKTKHEKCNPRHCRSTSARQLFAADRSECLAMKQAGCFGRCHPT